MFKTSKFFMVVAVLILSAGSLLAISISVKLSGPGVVNDSTIKVGKKVSFDIYIDNDATFQGFTMGFKLTSPDIKNIIHVPDSG
ncbi:MAG: hypothetical protein GXO93_03010, partial [FCB group bacterium]|nr:hypothetical protein [FCB group bacterium]